MSTENTNPPPAQSEPQAPALALNAGSALGKYDPLDSLANEVERFMRTNLFTPMEVTGFYIQARCVISELRELRKENEYLRNVRDRQAAIIRKREADIIELEEQALALPPNKADMPSRNP